MGLKKQLGAGVVAAALGLALVGGGTYAYFSDSEEAHGTFAAGTLDLAAQPSTIIDIDNMKPGDSVEHDFELQNKGTLDIKSVTLKTDYNVADAKGDNREDFGKYIEVEFLYNADQLNQVVYKTTLDKLKSMSPAAIKEKVFDELMEDGLKAGEEDDMLVKFNFLDSGENQNQFQGDRLELNWTFNAEQGKDEDL
ncbi:TasA family protein [Virgibacillus halophilus]|uniref:TasA family protein n=1 Tax=Tigheibacillus halophilus TaxID=361280 RepID=UPI0036317467